MKKVSSYTVRGAISTALWKIRETEIPRRAGVKLKHPNAPVTGNLKFNATKIEHLGKTSVVYIDENIAPYMPYTNEPWISPKWKGAKNPNEKWFDKFALKFATQLANELGGTLRINKGE